MQGSKSSIDSSKAWFQWQLCCTGREIVVL